MSEITRRLSAYITETGTDLKKMSEKTVIPYTCLYDSLRHTDRDRPLRDYELAAICNYLGKDVSDFPKRCIHFSGRVYLKIRASVSDESEYTPSTAGGFIS